MNTYAPENKAEELKIETNRRRRNYQKIVEFIVNKIVSFY